MAKCCPNQNGAPVRLVVPWKYGFKSGKSIVRIRFVEKQPKTAWEKADAERVRLLLERESGRRSSALEPEARAAHSRVLRASARHCSFNGYGDQVASLYAGMDLKKFY